MTSFQPGDRVRINDGVFMHFIGVVTEVNVERKMLKASVTVFDRPLAIEFRFSQVKKAA
ncbi:MAG TPA: hypothetical protein VEJ00_05390 [Candidatus Acidoferrales bacterium]|nr:hypothetical protein [Candidatus Acidoferrales bacterium]